MAALTDDVVTFAAAEDYEPLPIGAIVDTFFRGALVFYAAAGQITPVSAVDLEFAGIVAERTVITTLNDAVKIYTPATSRLFLFANSAFTIANQGALVAQSNASTDNPADLTITIGVGSTAAVGRIVAAKTSGTDGWIDISDRSATAT